MDTMDLKNIWKEVDRRNKSLVRLDNAYQFHLKEMRKVLDAVAA